jgi:hypothetical protein
MLKTGSSTSVLPAERGLWVYGGDAFHIIIAVLSGLLGFVFWDPIRGSDGQTGVGSGGVGTVGAVRGGFRVVVGVSGVFAVGGCVQAVSVGSTQPVA